MIDLRKYMGIKRIASLNESARLNNRRYTKLSMKTSILEDLISKHGGKANKLGEAFGIKGFHRIDKDNNISELYIQSKNADRKNIISLAKESSASITEIYGIVQFNGDEPEANGVYNDNPTFTYADQRSYQDDETGIRPMNTKKDDSDNVERDMVTDEPKSEEDFKKKEEESPKKKETEETSDSEDEETEGDMDDEENSDSEKEDEEENSDDSSEEDSDSEEENREEKSSEEEDTSNEEESDSDENKEEISDKDSEDEEVDNGENSSNEEENSDDDFGDDSEEESDSEEVADDDFGDDSDEDTESDDDFDDDDFDSEDENPNESEENDENEEDEEDEEDAPEEEEIDSGEEKDKDNEEQESADESKKPKKKKFGNRLLSSTEVGAVSGFQVGAVDRILPVSDHLPYPPAGIVPRVMNPRKRKIQIIDGRIK